MQVYTPHGVCWFHSTTFHHLTVHHSHGTGLWSLFTLTRLGSLPRGSTRFLPTSEWWHHYWLSQWDCKWDLQTDNTEAAWIPTVLTSFSWFCHKWVRRCNSRYYSLSKNGELFISLSNWNGQGWIQALKVSQQDHFSCCHLSFFVLISFCFSSTNSLQ